MNTLLRSKILGKAYLLDTSTVAPEVVCTGWWLWRSCMEIVSNSQQRVGEVGKVMVDSLMRQVGPTRLESDFRCITYSEDFNGTKIWHGECK